MSALSEAKQLLIRECRAKGMTIPETARLAGVGEQSVKKYGKASNASPATVRQDVSLPLAKQDHTDLPDAIHHDYTPFAISTPGTWLILNDVHVPWHDRTTIELAVSEAKRRNAIGVILNGDILDSHEISRHDQEPGAPRYVEEVELGKQLLTWIRQQLPRAEIIYKQGNHEERLERYIIQRAPALFGLEGIDLASLLHLKNHGIQWVGDKRVIELGKLCVLHGHEYPGGGGVNPARWLFLRARYVSLCGHFHRTSSHRDRNVRMKFEAAWSVGAACYLHPRYRPINSWNNGCAFVEVDQEGDFQVDNRALFNGKLV